MTTRTEYDPTADALYIYLERSVIFGLLEAMEAAARPRVAQSIVVDEGRVVDLDDQGQPVGIEVLGASTGVHLTDIIDRFNLFEFKADLQTVERTTFRPAAAG